MLFLVACSGEKSDPFSWDTIAKEDADLILRGDGEYENHIVEPLVKIDDCDFIVSGRIEYLLDGVSAAEIDYGDGTCDNLATKTVDGEVIEFELDTYVDNHIHKIVVEPLVILEDCDFIVSGIIEFYKEEAWVATINFGDGTCDKWAIKTTDEGEFEFSLDDWGKN